MPTAYPGQPAYSSYGSGYVAGAGPVAWTPPENMSWEEISIIESEEGVIESGVGGSTDVVINPANTGISAYLSNVWQAAFNVAHQLHIAPEDAANVVNPATISDLPIPQSPQEGPIGGGILSGLFGPPPSTYYEGPIGGAGFLGLFAPAPGSPEYEAYLARNRKNVKETEPDVIPDVAPGVIPDVIPAAEEGWWSGFWGAAKSGYNLEPKPPGQVGDSEDRNVFQESLNKWGVSLTNLGKTPQYATALVVGGAVLLLLLVLKR